MAKSTSGINEMAQRQRTMSTDLVSAYDRKLAAYAALRCDYNVFDDDKRERIQDAAVEIKLCQKRRNEDLLKIGQRLIEVSEMLESTLFGAWLHEEFDLSVRMAQNFMNVARIYGNNCGEIISQLSATTLYLLSAPSVTADARALVARIALDERRTLSVAEVRKIISHFMPDDTTKPDAGRVPDPPSPPVSSLVIDGDYRLVSADDFATQIQTFVMPQQGSVADLVTSPFIRLVALDVALIRKLFDAIEKRVLVGHMTTQETIDLQLALSKALEIRSAPE